MNSNFVLTVHQLMEELQISEPTAYRLVHEDGFPLVRVGRKVLIPREGLNAWLQRQSGITWQD